MLPMNANKKTVQLICTRGRADGKPPSAFVRRRPPRLRAGCAELDPREGRDPDPWRAQPPAGDPECRRARLDARLGGARGARSRGGAARAAPAARREPVPEEGPLHRHGALRFLIVGWSWRGGGEGESSCAGWVVIAGGGSARSDLLLHAPPPPQSNFAAWPPVGFGSETDGRFQITSE